MTERTVILAGDVGGTKIHLALYDFREGKLAHIRDQRYPARQYSGLEEIAKEFLGVDEATMACFGVPGPVREGRLRLTNLPWTLDSRQLAADLKIGQEMELTLDTLLEDDETETIVWKWKPVSTGGNA